MIKAEQFNYFSTYLIGKEAEKRGVKAKRFFANGILSKTSAMLLKYKNHEEVIIGQRTSKTDCIAFWIQHNKALAKFFFKKAGIQVTPGEVFHYKETDKILEYADKIGYPVVIKPLAGIQGKKVFLGINSREEVKNILQEFIQGNFKKVLIEKEFKGKEYRIFATKDKYVAAIARIPANVTGDGTHTIEELVEIKNKDPRRGEGHQKSLVKIKIDKTAQDFLKQQNKGLSYVPQEGEQVFLRANSNLSTGGDSIDVTDAIHPEVKKLAVKIIRSIPGLAYAGIDYLTTDITKKPNKNNYIVIEVNDSPMISMHHIPYEGKTRDVAKEIVDMIFPETVVK